MTENKPTFPSAQDLAPRGATVMQLGRGIQSNKSMTKKQFVIRSIDRDWGSSFFVAIHGWTPMFSAEFRAKRFDSMKAATEYANKELFTSPRAFDILEAQATA